MTYENLGQTLSLAALEERRKQLLSPYGTGFKWRSEYLYMILAVGGVAALAMLYKIKQNRKKKGRK